MMKKKMIVYLFIGLGLMGLFLLDLNAELNSAFKFKDEFIFL